MNMIDSESKTASATYVACRFLWETFLKRLDQRHLGLALLTDLATAGAKGQRRYALAEYTDFPAATVKHSTKGASKMQLDPKRTTGAIPDIHPNGL